MGKRTAAYHCTPYMVSATIPQIGRAFEEQDPARLPWRKLEIDIVLECTGMFKQLPDLQRHLAAGAKTVILSAPAKSPETATVVHRVNTADGPTTGVISCASCTTNCITPVVEVMGRRIGVEKAIMTTVHAYHPGDCRSTE